MKKDIPERWLEYKPIGERIEGTKIIAFKVPLKQSLCERNLKDQQKDWFTLSALLESQPQLKAVIDLTNTHRYYDPTELRSKAIDHYKILVVGRQIPPSHQVIQFFKAMDDCMKKLEESPDALIGVHCTHGLNRTGYFICRWMVERMNIPPEDAISRFQAARGYPMERVYLVNDIRNQNQRTLLPVTHYASPLMEDSYETESSRSYDRRPRPNFSRRKRHRARSRNNPEEDNSSRYRERNRPYGNRTHRSRRDLSRDYSDVRGRNRND